MDDKQKLIVCLNNAKDFKSSIEIAKEIGISKRRAIYLLQCLKDENKENVISNKSGYELRHKINLNTSNNNSSHQTYESRKNYIIKTLLLDKSNYTVFELANFFSITEGTLNNELSKIRKELKPLNLSLSVNNSNYLYIVGDEEDKRHLVSSFILNESKNSFYSLNKMQALFNNVDLFEIKNIVLNVTNKNKYFIDELSLTNYILHIAIIIEMNMHNSNKSNNYQHIDISNPHICNIVNEIFNDLSNRYNIAFSSESINNTILLFTTRLVSEKLNNINVNSIVSEDAVKIANKIIILMKEEYSLDINKSNFIYRFTLHLNSLLYRIKNGVIINPIQFEDVKANYPFMFSIAVSIANLIQKSFKFYVNENELPYIALHIASMYEEINIENNKVNVLIVATDYQNIPTSIYNTLKTKFYDLINFVDILTNIDNIQNYNDVDLIVTNFDLPLTSDINIAKVNSFLTNKDLTNISALINNIIINKKIISNESNLKYFFKEDLFFVDENLTASNDVIDFICDKLLNYNLVFSEYKEQIYEHEKISSSAYGDIAIPHPLNNDSKTSVISIFISNSGIKWGNNLVHIIFMISLKNEDKSKFKSIFDAITDAVTDINLKPLLLQSKTLNEFLSIIFKNC